MATSPFYSGPTRRFQTRPGEVGQRFFGATRNYWRDWVRFLGIPFEWQEAVIRAAITIKLAALEDTGAIVAAMTTSLPEAPDSGRNWDYRYCWLRDSYFVVSALNRLSVTRTMERYLHYIVNLAANRRGERLQPVYGLTGQPHLHETVVTTLPGFRGMGPVRTGNDAHRQIQNDVYGAAILSATHMFFDERIERLGNEGLFNRLEALGEMARARLRPARRRHLGTALPGARPHLLQRHVLGGLRPAGPHRRSVGPERPGGLLAGPRGGPCTGDLRARMERGAGELRGELRRKGPGREPPAARTNWAFWRRTIPGFRARLQPSRSTCKRGDFIFRYAGSDDFGEPETAFLVCTFWYVDALAALGRREEARALFETLLGCRNALGLLSEDIDPATRELWGNFPQTYSMVGLINSAMRLSRSWEGVY